jgi:hypothetical protein
MLYCLSSPTTPPHHGLHLINRCHHLALAHPKQARRLDKLWDVGRVARDTLGPRSFFETSQSIKREDRQGQRPHVAIVTSGLSSRIPGRIAPTRPRRRPQWGRCERLSQIIPQGAVTGFAHTRSSKRHPSTCASLDRGLTKGVGRGFSHLFLVF